MHTDSRKLPAIRSWMCILLLIGAASTVLSRAADTTTQFVLRIKVISEKTKMPVLGIRVHFTAPLLPDRFCNTEDGAEAGACKEFPHMITGWYDFDPTDPDKEFVDARRRLLSDHDPQLVTLSIRDKRTTPPPAPKKGNVQNMPSEVPSLSELLARGWSFFSGSQAIPLSTQPTQPPTGRIEVTGEVHEGSPGSTDKRGLAGAAVRIRLLHPDTDELSAVPLRGKRDTTTPGAQNPAPPSPPDNPKPNAPPGGQSEPEQFSVLTQKDGKYTLAFYSSAPLNLYLLTIQKEGYKSTSFFLQNAGAQRDMVLEETKGEIQTLSEEETSIRYAAVGQNLTALPLGEGTNLDKIALLFPGVVPIYGGVPGPAIAPGLGSSEQISVNGFRGKDNNFSLDGADNNDEDSGTRRRGFLLASPRSLDAIEEFQLVTALPDARFGRNIGAQINALSKGALQSLESRKFHLQAIGRWDRAALDARNTFDFVGPASGSGSLGGKDQTGGSVRRLVFEAPILLQRGQDSQPGGLFWVLSFERQIHSAQNEAHFSVPTASERINAVPGQRGLSMPGLGILSLFPLPNQPAGPFGANTYATLLSNDKTGRILSNRLDKVGGFLRGLDVMASVTTTGDNSGIPQVGDALFSSLNAPTRTTNVAFIAYAKTGPLEGSTFRLSYGRTALSIEELRQSGQVKSTLLPGIPFLLNVPIDDPPRVLINGATIPLDTSERITGPLGQVAIAGYSKVGLDVYNLPQERVNNTFQLAYANSLIRSKHALTYGADYRRIQLNTKLARNERPLASFQGLLDIPGPVGSARISFPQNRISALSLAAMGIPTGLFQTLSTTGDDSLGIRADQIDSFLQDSWRVGKRAQLLGGLRFEANPQPNTIRQKLENGLNSTQITTFAQSTTVSCGARCNDLATSLQSAFPPTYKVAFGADRGDVAARLALAYGLGEDGRTVLRTGFGIYSGPIPLLVLSQSRSTFPTFLPVNWGQSPYRIPFSQVPGRPATGGYELFFNPANPAVSVPGSVVQGSLNALARYNPLDLLVNNSVFPEGLYLDVTDPQNKLKGPYAYHYLVSGDRQLPDNFILSLAYVGTRSLKLLNVDTPVGGANRVSSVGIQQLDTTAAGFPSYAASLTQLQHQVSQSFAITQTKYESNGASWYNSLQAQIRGRLGGLEFSSAFTYSHSVDEASDFFETTGAYALAQARKFNSTDGEPAPTGKDIRSERASSSFDARYRSVSHFIWDLPGSMGKRWQLSGIISAQSGQPYTVNSAFDINQDGNLTDRLDNTVGLSNSPNGDRRVSLQMLPGALPISLLAEPGHDGSIGRNTFRGPGIFNVDAALSRRFFSNTRGLLLRIEAYNLFNRAQYGLPVRILESPAFGRSTNTLLPNRTIQMVLKVGF